MICGPLLCASITRIGLMGGMKRLLIVRSGNVILVLLALIDLFTFQRLSPVWRERARERERNAQKRRHCLAVIMFCFKLFVLDAQLH